MKKLLTSLVLLVSLAALAQQETHLVTTAGPTAPQYVKFDGTFSFTSPPLDAQLSGTNYQSDFSTNKIVANFGAQAPVFGATPTNYSLTTTITNVVFGETNNPFVLLPRAGTYLILPSVNIGGSATIADRYLFYVYDLTNSTVVPGTGKVLHQTVANYYHAGDGPALYTVTAPSGLWLQAANATGARGACIATNTTLVYIRLN